MERLTVFPKFSSLVVYLPVLFVIVCCSQPTAAPALIHPTPDQGKESQPRFKATPVETIAPSATGSVEYSNNPADRLSTDSIQFDPGSCTLAGGEIVVQGWSGNDTGSNYCNKCRCMSGNLACTKMACHGFLKPGGASSN